MGAMVVQEVGTVLCIDLAVGHTIHILGRMSTFGQSSMPTYHFLL